MTQIKKRNGQLEKYDGYKIINAIEKAMAEGSGVEEDISRDIESKIRQHLLDNLDAIFSVEEVSDMVEYRLMDAGKYNTAKRYILYREKQKESKKDIATYNYKFLSQEFLEKYRNTPEPFDALGSFVFYRTYSRFLPEKGRREKWMETVARAVDYNCSLAPTSRKEAEKLFDNMFHLRQTLSGRAMWSSPIGDKANSGLSFFNCSASTISGFEDILDGFYLLLVGAGFGFRVLPEDIKKFPKIRKDIDIISQNYSPKTTGRQEYTTTEHHSKEMMVVHVGDSRNAWIDGLRILFQVYADIKYATVKTLVFNYDNIRPAGLPIKGFGGKSSGAVPYITMIEGVNNVLSKDRDLKTIDVVDILNMIGMCVVSGNVRRSSEICLFDKNDTDILNSKSELYKIVDGSWVIDEDIIHRQMSNNTIMYTSKPTKEELHEHINKMRYSGEPGFASLPAMKKRHKDAENLNPCAEILILDNKGLCNLTGLNMLAFVNDDGTYRRDDMLDAQKMSARAGYRVTCLDLELPEWDYNQKKHRSLGCSLSGIQDFINATKISDMELRKLFEDLRDVAIEEANRYADELGLNHASLVTTIKPSGSSSQLYGESSGVHFSHSPHFIRRVRVSVEDPLLKVAEDIGMNINNEVGQSEEQGNLKTKVVDFYCKSPKGRTKYDVSAIEQLEFYKLIMEHYVTHNASITVHVRNHEWDDVEQWLWDNWDDVIAVSFLSLDESFYELLPYESITEEEYNEKCSIMNNKFTTEVLQKYEKVMYEASDDELDSECSGGGCAVR